MPTSYDVGDQVRLKANFTNEAGAAADPTSVTLKVRTPAGVTTSYTSGAGQVTSTVVGTWTRIIDITEAGVWSYRFEGTGALKAAEDAQFVVDASVLA